MLIQGYPVIFHTINAFTGYSSAIRIIVSIHPDYVSYWEELCRKHQFNTAVTLVKGGKTRFDSVKNALVVAENTGPIAVHDSVRPLVSKETIQRAYEYAEINGSAVPFITPKETIRKMEGKQSIPLDRSEYRLIQTPQCFRAEILHDAYNIPYQEKYTDDASVVEEAGNKIFLFEGEEENIKITTPLDLVIASALIKALKL